jgi:hypothetical protein
MFFCVLDEFSQVNSSLVDLRMQHFDTEWCSSHAHQVLTVGVEWGRGDKETVPHCGYWFCSSLLLYVPITRNYTWQAAYLLLPLSCISLSLFRGQMHRNAVSVSETHRSEPPDAAVTSPRAVCEKYYKRNYITYPDCWRSTCLKPYCSA